MLKPKGCQESKHMTIDTKFQVNLKNLYAKTWKGLPNDKLKGKDEHRTFIILLCVPQQET